MNDILSKVERERKMDDSVRKTQKKEKEKERKELSRNRNLNCIYVAS